MRWTFDTRVEHAGAIYSYLPTLKGRRAVATFLEARDAILTAPIADNTEILTHKGDIRNDTANPA